MLNKIEFNFWSSLFTRQNTHTHTKRTEVKVHFISFQYFYTKKENLIKHSIAVDHQDDSLCSSLNSIINGNAIVESFWTFSSLTHSYP